MLVVRLARAPQLHQQPAASPVHLKTLHPRAHTRTPSSRAARASAAKDERQQQRQPQPGGPASEEPEQQEEVTILQALTAIGLNGTIAVSGAALCGIDLAGLFHFERLQDLQLALQLTSVLLLLEAALFVPAYTIPPSMLEAPQQQQQQQGHAPQQQQQQDPQQQRYLDVGAIAGLSTWSLDAWRLMLAMLRAVIRRPQLGQLPLPASVGLMAGREATKELLQRGFVVVGLGAWLTDRLYEADLGGPGGLVQMPGGVPTSVQELGLLAASVVATSLFAPAAYIAAEEAAAAVSGALLLHTDAGRTVRSIAAAATAGRRRQQGGSGDGGSSGDNARVQRLQPPPLPQARSSAPGAAGAGRAAAAAGGGAGSEDDDDDEPLDPLVLEYRLVKVTEACWGSAPASLAYRLTLAKELGRIMLANLAFVVTGENLAATLTAGLVANGLLLVYARVLGGSDADAAMGGLSQPQQQRRER